MPAPGDADGPPAHPGGGGRGRGEVGAPKVTEAHYRATMGHFCTGVTIVTGAGTTSADSGVAVATPAGLTCQSFASVSLDPPLVLVCPGRASGSWPRIEATGAFCVNVLAEDQEELGRAFAQRGGEKFEGVGWTPGPFSGSPVLAGVLAWIECRVEQVHEAGDHFIAVGRVLDLGAREGRPLLFFRGGYGRFDV